MWAWADVEYSHFRGKSCFAENVQGLSVWKHLLFEGEESFGCSGVSAVKLYSFGTESDTKTNFPQMTYAPILPRTESILFRPTLQDVQPKDAPVLQAC